MTKSGTKPAIGRPRQWRKGPVDTVVRLPASLVNEVLRYARLVDEGAPVRLVVEDPAGKPKRKRGPSYWDRYARWW